MRKHTYYEMELTDKEAEDFTDFWEEEMFGLPEDPWRGTKRQLMCFLNDLRPSQESEMTWIIEKAKALKDDDEILMVLGL